MTHALLAQRPVEVVRTSSGHILKAFRGDHITRQIKSSGIYEKNALQLLGSILERIPDAVVLDVGANIGNHSLYFSLKAARVFAFEPVGEIFGLLENNVRSNGVGNVRCFNLGLSDREAKAEIYVDDTGNIGTSSLEKLSAKAHAETVKLVRGDDWLKANPGIERIDFIKIDVESHEPKVLDGLRGILAAFRPILMMEYKSADILRAFAERGGLPTIFPDYRIFVIESNYARKAYPKGPLGKLQRSLVRTFREEAARLYRFDPARTYQNILLVPREKLSVLPPQALTRAARRG